MFNCLNENRCHEFCSRGKTREANALMPKSQSGISAAQALSMAVLGARGEHQMEKKKSARTGSRWCTATFLCTSVVDHRSALTRQDGVCPLASRTCWRWCTDNHSLIDWGPLCIPALCPHSHSEGPFFGRPLFDRDQYERGARARRSSEG